ncbi:hypothetical protein [Rhodanobacter sp. A1T4]|uniref:hypothetical protein n=1 Tax=Rhodanobacter sp. A1T4 TaxID=2723087 RepID=UPI00161111B3|nr:hypothetical protein [Rhodanobacter sp. A1T4]MBB6249199.1 hypothetical protein [Rhodanobacter sp. A1T4]
MKDFVRIDVVSELGQDAIFQILKEALPSFQWRQGDSDAQGPYVSGMHKDGVKIQAWLGEQPVAVSASFRAAWREDPAREEKKNAVLVPLLELACPALGAVQLIRSVP